VTVQAKSFLERARIMSGRTQRRKAARRAYTVWIALAVCALIPLPLVQSFAVGPDPGEPSRLLPLLASSIDHGTLATMQFLSSLFAFTVAFVILMRFSALGNHLYLIMGLGFCIVGTEDLLHGLAASVWLGHWAGKTLFVTTTYVTARILLVGLFIYAFLTSRPNRRRQGWRTGPVGAALIVIGLAGGVFFFSLYCLADLNQSAARPVDLVLTLLFVAAVPFAVHHYERDPGPFQSSLVTCLLLIVCSQFYSCVSGQLFDPPFIAALSLKLGSCIAPLLGVSRGLIHQHLLLEEQKRRMANQAAQLWQQSNTLTRTNALLKAQANKLQEVSRLKSQFLANMSHEFRTPLNAIIGFSDSLLDCDETDPLTDWQADRVRKIALSGGHLLGLVSDLLDLAKIESGTVTLRVSRFNPRDLVYEVTEVLQPLFDRNPRTELRLEVDTGLEQTVSLDREKLKQILTNLIANACKFTDSGSVTVVARSAEGRVVFEVADTGVGIAATNLEVIFERFHQLDGGAARRAGGAGLGLALVKELTGLMGGTVSVQSRLGSGTTFRVDLPAHLDGEPATVRERMEVLELKTA
jgi:signal transduction histidine kinase